MTIHQFHCVDCKSDKTHESDFTTGYAVLENEDKICYECAGKRDRQYMIDKGKICLYLDGDKVSNWPGSLTFKARNIQKGCHNMAGSRYDFWFAGPDGHVWHGVQYGDNTQIAHCKRTKNKI